MNSRISFFIPQIHFGDEFKNLYFLHPNKFGSVEHLEADPEELLHSPVDFLLAALPGSNKSATH